MNELPETDLVARILVSLGCLTVVLAPVVGFLYGCSGP